MSLKFEFWSILWRSFLGGIFLVLFGFQNVRAENLPPLFDAAPAVGIQSENSKTGILRSKIALIHPGTLETMVTELLKEKVSKKKGNKLGAFSLNLFSDTTEEVVIDRIEIKGAKRWILRGHTQKGSGQISLVYWDGALTGQIELEHSRFAIQPQAASLPTDSVTADTGTGFFHEIQEIDLQNWAEAWNEKQDDSVVSPRIAVTRKKEDKTTAAVATPASTQIDILVLYDAPAVDAKMESLVTLAVDLANQAYEANQLPQRLRLVHAQPFTVKAGIDTTSSGAVLGSLPESTADLRKQYGADLVSFISKTTSGNCGIAYILNSTSGNSYSAFSVVASSCVAGNFSFTHELGHNMGCMHDSCTTTNPGLFSDSHGFIDVNRNIRSVMAYPHGSTTRLNRFSSSSQDYQGAPLGTGSSTTSTCNPEPGANNTKALLTSAPLISSYFGSVDAPKNTPPVASAGPDRVIGVRKTATLDGRKSYDADQDALTYKWVQFASDARKIPIVNPAQALAKVTPKAKGVYRFTLTVTDTHGATSSDSVRVTVK